MGPSQTASISDRPAQNKQSWESHELTFRQQPNGTHIKYQPITEPVSLNILIVIVDKLKMQQEILAHFFVPCELQRLNSPNKGWADEMRIWTRGSEGERGLSVLLGHKALPSDTCHWVGMDSLSAWQEVQASEQELKGRVYANSSGQRKWVPLMSVWRPDENGTCIPDRRPFRGQQ